LKGKGEGRSEKMRKNLMWISSIILLILSLLGGLTVNTIKVSAVETPAIYIDPAETWNTSLTPGMNYPILIRTNYTGNDIWSYQFELEYNPNVLHGGINITDTWIEPINMTATQTMFPTSEAPILEDTEKVYVNGTLKTKPADYVISYTPGLILFGTAPGAGAVVKATYLMSGLVNGDLITIDENPTAKFYAGDFNNTLGNLSQTMAYFDYPFPPDTASGPGILANVTFHAVSYGFSDITLKDTKMTRYNATADEFEDIDTIIQHGFFSNLPPRNDVAVTSLVVPATAAIEQPVPISVNVSNEGTYDESVTLTVKNGSAVIDTRVFTLEKGLNRTESFDWDTSGLLNNTSYDINATATIASDDEPGDNNATKSVTLFMLHDVAVTSLVVPATAAVEQPVPISVTVSNEGSYAEDVTLTVKNETTVIDTVLFSLAKGPTSNTSSFSWNTSGLSTVSYKINATATIASDDELGDNSANQSVTLSMVNDVAVTSLVVQTVGTVEHPVPINVTVSNEGSYAEDVTLTVKNNSAVIDTVLFSLAKGPTSNTSSFSWDTSGLSTGSYTIIATATIASDDEPGDNSKDKTITLLRMHNVDVVNITVPRRGNVNDTVSINVTVKNLGSYTETFNVSTKYIHHDDPNQTLYAITLPNGKNYTTVTDLAINESTTILFTWNTTDVAPDFYTIEAIAGITTTDTWTAVGITTTDTWIEPTNATAGQTIFVTTGNPILEDTEKVYVNGTLKTRDSDYIMNYTTGNITFMSAPGQGANVTATYSYLKKSFLTTQKLIYEKLEKVYVNQILMTRVKDYNISYSLGRIDFPTAPGVGTQIKATYESGLVNETYLDDNIKDTPWEVLVTILGDVDGDGIVDGSDLSELSEAYGSEPGDSNWNPYCDLNGDDKIDILDLATLGKNHGKTV